MPTFNNPEVEAFESIMAKGENAGNHSPNFSKYASEPYSDWLKETF